MSAVPAPWCTTCGPARLCNCGVVPDGLSAWLRANEQRTARAAPELIEDHPAYGEAGIVARRPIG